MAKILLKDHRDIPFLKQLLLTLLLFLPLSIFLLTKHSAPLWLRMAYWVFFVYMLGPHLLMLHNVCHRSPWKKPFKNFMNNLLEFIGLFFGLPPRLYYHHHIKMHHKEGNGPDDLSSTEKYQRDNFFHWLLYFLDFIILTPFELPRYFIRRNRWDYALKVTLAYMSFYSLIVFSYLYNPEGTITVFIIPTLICWFGLMAGNWTQHAFIDPFEPNNDYKNSITVVDSLYNKRCFNDGYHIGHHLRPGMHWTEMPTEFEKNRDLYKKNEAIIFKTLDYQAIWFLLMTKRYRKLSQYYVGDLSREEFCDKVNLHKYRYFTSKIVW